MGIEKILSTDRVTVRLAGCNRHQALSNVAGSLAIGHPELGASAIYKSLLCREALGSTAIGDGIAIPHARVPGITKTELVVAMCPDGVEFQSADGQPVRILVGILSPEDTPRETLKTLSEVVRCLKQPKVRAALESANSPEAVVEAMCPEVANA